MSITNLQQARQMYAMGQRVGRIAFGGGGSYVSGGGSGQYQGGSAAPGSAEAAPGGGGSSYEGGGGDPGGYKSTTGKSTPTGTLTGDDYRKARRDFDVGVAGGYAKDQVTGPRIGPYLPGTYQPFLDKRPKVNIPNLGLSGMFLNLFNKGVNSPIQKFADFTTAKNRNYFMDEVVRAGKIPGLNYGTVSEMTNDELEAAYKGYLSDRLSGATDAYGNPLNQGGGEGANQGIAALYNYNMFDDTETENANDPFVSRFLQNQPDDIREGIESKMQNYYTV